MTQKAVFFDRDDTLISDPGCIQRPDQVNLLPGVPEALIQLNKMGYLLVIVTNQPGIAMGVITEKELDQVHQELKRKLAARNTIIDGLYYCPYHPHGEVKKYSIESNLRMPNTGMFLQAEEDFDIDLTQSWMIGDSYQDIQAGKAAGCHTILVDVPGKIREKKKNDPEPDRKAVNLREAVNIIRMVEFHRKAQSVKDFPEQNQDPEEYTESPDPEPVDENASDEPGVKVIDPFSPPEQQITETVEEAPTQSQPNTETEAEDVTEEEPQAIDPKPAKVYTAKNPEQTKTKEQIEPNNETLLLLEEIALRLKHRDREGLYREFSVFKLLAVMVQTIALLFLVFSVFYWLSPEDRHVQVMTTIAFSIALQLFVIALLMMHSKDKRD